MPSLQKIQRDADRLASGLWLRCWACNEVISHKSRSAADGNCPKCGNEIELDTDAELGDPT